jgi:flagellar biosynthetic protein FlhB
MSDSEQDKTEAPTPRRREEAAEEGRLPKSPDVGAAALLLAAALAIGTTGPGLARALRDITGTGLGFGAAAGLTAPGAVALVQDLGWKALAALAGFLAALSGTALVVGAAQARGTFTLQPLAPKFSRMNPAQNVKRVIGVQGVVEAAKGVLKLVVVGYAVYAALRAAWPDVTALGAQSPRALVEVMRRHGVKLLANAGMTALGLAALDYGWALWKHERDLRMTKEEVKQESKNQDGDPMVKQRMRALGRQRARQQMMKDVPKADVVVVNPVHIAVALRYDPNVAPAPYVVAVGRRKVAERIKEIAFASRVPVVENVPLARALVASVKVNMVIPAELYLAVAEVLAYVMRQRAATQAAPGAAGAAGAAA